MTSRGLSTSGNVALWRAWVVSEVMMEMRLGESTGRAPTDGDLSSMCRDGIPPYRIGSKKQLQREMHRSVKANGQVSLPHFPVSSGGSWQGPGWPWEAVGLGMGTRGGKGAGEVNVSIPT